VADLAIWVQAPSQLCEQRWRKRDGAAMSAHLPAWWQAQEAHFARYRTRERADFAVDTTTASR
jgi:cytidylate kinase